MAIKYYCRECSHICVEDDVLMVEDELQPEGATIPDQHGVCPNCGEDELEVKYLDHKTSNTLVTGNTI